MVDYEKVIHGLVDPLIVHPEALIIREIPSTGKNDVCILIIAENDDTARLIGKKGVVANALREAVGIATKADDSNIHIHLKFESFDEEDKGDAE